MFLMTKILISREDGNKYDNFELAQESGNWNVKKFEV